MKEKRKSPIRFPNAAKLRERTNKNVDARIRNAYVKARKTVEKDLREELLEISNGIKNESDCNSYVYSYTFPKEYSDLEREVLLKEIRKRLDKYGYDMNYYRESVLIRW